MAFHSGRNGMTIPFWQEWQLPFQQEWNGCTPFRPEWNGHPIPARMEWVHFIPAGMEWVHFILAGMEWVHFIPVQWGQLMFLDFQGKFRVWLCSAQLVSNSFAKHLPWCWCGAERMIKHAQTHKCQPKFCFYLGNELGNLISQFSLWDKEYFSSFHIFFFTNWDFFSF